MDDIGLYYFEFTTVPVVWLSVAVFNAMVFVKINRDIPGAEPSTVDPLMMFGYTVAWPVFIPFMLIIIFMIACGGLFVHLWDAKND